MPQLIARRELSSEEAVGGCLEQTRLRDREVRAWQYLDPDRALEQARTKDRHEPAGSLHGVPVGIKDIIDTADMPTELGTEIHAARRPKADAECVKRLREAGAVILGKTVTTEFATKHPATTTNPHNIAHTPGGSSSGSAAAVAAGMVPLALGTQTVGSTIRPATFCGVFGMKPTWGAVDMTGVNRTSARLDTIGLFARSAEDLGLLFDALAPDRPDPGSYDDDTVYVAATRTPWWRAADDDSAAAYERAAQRLRTAGAVVDDIELPAEFAPVPDVHDTITVADLAECLGGVYEAHADRLSASLRTDIERGMAITEAVYADADAATARCRDSLARLFDRYDALLVPAVTGEAPRGLGSTGDPIFCRAWSLLGPPAIAVPAGHGSHGLPVGVQLIGPHGRDRSLLRLADRLGRTA
jgi:amidase